MISNAPHVHNNVSRKRFDQDALEKGDHRPKWSADRLIWKAIFAAGLCLIALLALPAPARAGAPVGTAWRVFLEPKFMRPPTSLPVANAERTVLAAGYLGENGLETLKRGELDELGCTLEEFVKRAAENADADVPLLRITYVRNRKKVIEYAEVHSSSGVVASALLAPTFLPLFQDTLGPEVIIALPCREVAYVFPKLASNFEDYAPMVLQSYRESAHPVTLEVFEIGPAGIKAAGRYPDPARD